MYDHYIDMYDPYQEMTDFYRLDDPTEDDQFRFVEAMEYLIRESFEPDDIEAFSYNLAMYYRDIRNFQLEKKYLEIAEKQGSRFCKEHLGFIWYYGLCDEPDYEKAYHLFKECDTRTGQFMIADMYHFGQFVEKSDHKCREILEDLFDEVESERKDPMFVISTLFPEISLRLVRLNVEEKMDTMFDLDCLLDSRDILSERQRRRPFWGNIRTMHEILDLTVTMTGEGFDFADLYDLLTLKEKNATVTFDYEGKQHQIDILTNTAETIYQYDDRWYHGAGDFLEKARIDGKRVTSIYDLITDIRVTR